MHGLPSSYMTITLNLNSKDFPATASAWQKHKVITSVGTEIFKGVWFVFFIVALSSMGSYIAQSIEKNKVVERRNFTLYNQCMAVQSNPSSPREERHIKRHCRSYAWNTLSEQYGSSSAPQ